MPGLTEITKSSERKRRSDSEGVKKIKSKKFKIDGLSLVKDDPYLLFLEKELAEEERLESIPKNQFLKLGWTYFGQSYVSKNLENDPPSIIDEFNIIPLLKSNLNNAFCSYRGPGTPQRSEFSQAQKELLSLIFTYKDVAFQSKTDDMLEDVRFALALHAMNHIFKSYINVNQNNNLIHDHQAKEAEELELRDRGLLRPKVLIIAPYRHSAFQIVMHMLAFIEGKIEVMNKKRFLKEFHQSADEDFKVGLSLTKSNFKIFSKFYSSDIIIASPLGLRTIIKAEGEKDRDYDFLASIEVLMIDQFECLLMQNIKHLFLVLKSMHLNPRDFHGTDLTRARIWALDGYSRYYRQTIILSKFQSALVRIIFNKYAHNHFGGIQTFQPLEGILDRINTPCPKVFMRFYSNGDEDKFLARYNFFVNRIYPQIMNKSHVLIYINSEVDWQFLNHFVREKEISYCVMSEHMPEKYRAEARDLFFRGDRKMMILTATLHFYKDFKRRFKNDFNIGLYKDFNRKFKIKGVHHIVFYNLPPYPELFLDACEFLPSTNKIPDGEGGEIEPSCCAIFNYERDLFQLLEILGNDRVIQINNDDDNNFVF